MTINTRHWLFRVASRADQGGGHISRSLVLAKAWQDKVTFCLDIDSPYAEMVKKAGYDVITPDQEQGYYDGVFLDVYSTDNFDHYRAKTDCLMILEGFKDFYDKADIYLRPFPGDYTEHGKSLILSGLEYALVDACYQQRDVQISDHVETVTITMGRYDSKNTTRFILEKLQTRSEKFHTNIVLGGNAPHLETVKKYLENEYNRPYNLHVDLPNLVDLYRQTDLLFSSGGVASLEACAMRVPCVVMSFVDDQKALGQFMGDKGVTLYAGHFGHTSEDHINDTINRAFNYETRQSLISCEICIDTNCAQRVYEAVSRYQHTQEAVA